MVTIPSGGLFWILHNMDVFSFPVKNCQQDTLQNKPPVGPVTSVQYYLG